MGIKMSQKQFPKYVEKEVDRLVAILKTNNCGGGGGPFGIQ